MQNKIPINEDTIKTINCILVNSLILAIHIIKNNNEVIKTQIFIDPNTYLLFI